MALYSPQIESQIAQALRLRGRVAPDSLPGLTDDEGAEFLARFAADHPGHVAYDGVDLVPVAHPAPSVPPQPAPTPGDAAEKLSPVEQVLASGQGTSLLDTRRSQGKVAGWLWILPLTFLLPGGIIAWFIAKDQNRAVARTMLIVSAALTVLTVVTAPAIGPMMSALSGGGSPGAQSGVGLPASSTGEPAFYYFGTATQPECIQMQPVVNGLQAANAGRIDFKVYADINSDDEGEELAVGNGVRAMPTMVLVGADGRELQRWTGVQSAEALQSAFNEALR